MNKNRLTPLHASRLRDVLEKNNPDGSRVKFSITYACMNGGLVTITEKCIECIRAIPERHSRLIQSVTTDEKGREHRGEIRTIHDILILRVNNFKIVYN